MTCFEMYRFRRTGWKHRSTGKMENTICAEEDGQVAEIYVAENTNIEAGTVLLKLDT